MRSQLFKKLTISSLLLITLVFAHGARAEMIALSDAEQAHLTSKGRITMCVDPAWMPYESITPQGQHIGIAADYMEIFAESIGVPIELVPTTTWNQSLEYAQSRRCDILSLLNKNKERSQYLNFTDAYLDAAVVLVARDEVVYLNGFSDLAGRTLGVIKGYVYEAHIRDNYPQVKLVYVDNLDDALGRVSSGELYAAVDSLFIVTHHMQKLGFSNLKIAGKTDFTHALRVGVRKDDALLLSVMQKAVVAVNPVKRNELLQRWFTVRFEHGTDFTLLWSVLGVAGLVFVFLIYRYWTQHVFNTKLQASNAELERLSQTDPLTGVYNRLKATTMLDAEFERSRRYERPMSVVMFDLDHFKTVNDTFGHQAGDKVLIEASAMVQETIRANDVLGRWGGEEFLVLCPESTAEGAAQLAENLRARMEAMDIPDVGSVTASFGVAELMVGSDVKRLVGRADDALYQAKQTGRNRVCIYDPAG
ncbi:diguanylate cyclase [Pseudomonadota bacterium]